MDKSSVSLQPVIVYILFIYIFGVKIRRTLEIIYVQIKLVFDIKI